MKRMIKIIAAAMFITLLGVTLCSCQQLDDMKNNRAVYTDDSKETIEFRGNTYKRLTLPSDTISAMSFYESFGEGAYVTTKDVPVLLSATYGEEIVIDAKSDDPIIIQCYKEKTLTADSSYSLYSNSVYGYQFDREKCYVREDYFDDLKEELKDGNLDHYFYYDYDMKNFDPTDEIDYDMMNSDFEVKIEYKLIDDEMTAAINETLKSDKKIDYKKLKNHSYSSFSLSYCDKNLLFTDEAKTLMIFFDKTAKKYYLAPIAYGYSNYKDLIEVPEKYSQLFKKVMDEQKENLFEDDDLSMHFEDDYMDADDYEEGDSTAIKL